MSGRGGPPEPERIVGLDAREHIDLHDTLWQGWIRHWFCGADGVWSSSSGSRRTISRASR